MAIYLIGDIQGCYKTFVKLLEKISFNPKNDQLWCLGDMINRGSNSLEVLKLLYKLGDSCHCVLGNHEIHFLGVVAGIRKQNKDDTFDSLLSPANHYLIEWLRTQTFIHYIEPKQYWFVHAGLPPHWSTKRILEINNQLKQSLNSHNWIQLLKIIFNANHQPKIDDLLSHQQEYSMAVRYFTQMRFCTANGELDLQNKSSTTQSTQFKAWYEHPNIRSNHETYFFGHWAALQGMTNNARAFCLDTGCVWGEKLTILNLANYEKSSIINCE